MYTGDITPELLASSVISVPPLARDESLEVSRSENAKLISYLEAGGVTTVLYGGNALLYHVALSEYAGLLEVIAEEAADETWIIPSVGPGYGTMMDQAAVLREFDFPTAMILPQQGVATSVGIAKGVRHFVEAVGKPAVLYIKQEGFMEVADAAKLMADGLISWIKYAIVREDPSQDPYLSELIQQIGSDRIISGIGEQPAIAHLDGFGVQGFTSGCVCVAPALSMQMLQALKAGDVTRAEELRKIFRPLEDLRNGINPVRVLHSAVRSAGIADTGPILPLVSEVSQSEADEIGHAAEALIAAEQSALST
ncbi:MAG: dihydrodipicolinate synthase family protein [Pirellulaceae bacterium]